MLPKLFIDRGSNVSAVLATIGNENVCHWSDFRRTFYPNSSRAVHWHAQNSWHSMQGMLGAVRAEEKRAAEAARKAGM
jgi:hypothetical protein